MALSNLRLLLLFILVLSVCISCDLNSTSEIRRNKNVIGYKPIYGAKEQSHISLRGAQSIRNPGKIYIYGKYLLINERQKGIHVVDNSNPEQPQVIGFIEMLGNSDMAIKDEVLYADHLGNLVALQTSGFSEVKEIGKLPLRNWLIGIPPPAGNHFECVDQDKGFVIGWQKEMLKNPECYALN